MILHTTVAREADGLPLVASFETEQADDPLIETKSFVKPLLRHLAASLAQPAGSAMLLTEASLRAGKHSIHILVDGGIVFLCITDSQLPRILAFSFLIELAAALAADETASSSWRSAVRPFALIRFEPTMQSISHRYASPRALQSHTNLADLSARVQAIPSMHISTLLPQDYDKAMFKTKMTIANVASNVATAAEQFASGDGYSTRSRSWRTRYLVILTMIVLAIDWAYASEFGARWIRIWRWTTRDKYTKLRLLLAENILVAILTFLSPVLIYQMLVFARQKTMPSLASRITLAHTAFTFVQILYTLLVPVESAGRRNAASSSSEGDDETTLQKAAMFFSTFSIPAALVMAKLVYVLTILAVVGMHDSSAQRRRNSKLRHLD
ncbi:hypothetical protein BC831DRAFT_454260 [Entophlyctis helioformis]|nr:hypothetical protein BC831DRAFT_454260 [Entophlyctis helioformis]